MSLDFIAILVPAFGVVFVMIGVFLSVTRSWKICGLRGCCESIVVTMLLAIRCSLVWAVAFAQSTTTAPTTTTTTLPPSEQYFTTDPFATCAFHDTDGLGPVRFTFTTSDYADYEDDTVAAAMQIRIVLDFASFVEASDCANVIDATEGFPGLSTCYFSTREMKIQLQKRLKRATRYSFTVLMVMPSVELPDSGGNFNSYSLMIEYYQLRYVEQTRSPLALTRIVKLNADTYGASNTNGWVTEFTLRSQESYQAGVIQLVTFSLKTVGTMDSAYSIDIIAHPTDKWRL
ncbi:hypothetical protein FOZ62_021872, partial [Perkinsus olseni]